LGAFGDSRIVSHSCLAVLVCIMHSIYYDIFCPVIALAKDLLYPLQYNANYLGKGGY